MWQTFRRWILIGSLSVASIGAASESAEVNLDYVAQRALDRAHTPFHSPHADLPAVLRPENLDYDKFRQIEFRHDRALWAAANLPFRVEFFHPGYIYHEPVHVNEFTPTHTQPIRFVQDFFNYHKLNIAKQIPVDTGYAGFRVLNQLNSARFSARVISGCSGKICVTANPHAASRWIPAKATGRRNFPFSPTGGWASQAAMTMNSVFTRFSTA